MSSRMLTERAWNVLKANQKESLGRQFQAQTFQPVKEQISRISRISRIPMLCLLASGKRHLKVRLIVARRKDHLRHCLAQYETAEWEPSVGPRVDHEREIACSLLEMSTGKAK